MIEFLNHVLVVLPQLLYWKSWNVFYIQLILKLTISNLIGGKMTVMRKFFEIGVDNVRLISDRICSSNEQTSEDSKWS